MSDGTRQSSRCVRWVYAVCLSGAGLNHLRDIWQGGWLPYQSAPLPLNAYWTGLAIVDLAAAALLFLKPRWGLVLTALIIVSDVAVNTYARWALNYSGWYAEVSLQLQTLFLGFVMGALPFVWRGNVTPPSPGSASHHFLA